MGSLRSSLSRRSPGHIGFAKVGRSNDHGQKTLYVTGEESLGQVAMRARRLQVDASEVLLAAETRVEALLETIEAQQPAAELFLLMGADSLRDRINDADLYLPTEVSPVAFFDLPAADRR